MIIFFIYLMSISSCDNVLLSIIEYIFVVGICAIFIPAGIRYTKKALKT